MASLPVACANRNSYLEGSCDASLATTSTRLPPLGAILPGTKKALRDSEETKPFELCLEVGMSSTDSPPRCNNVEHDVWYVDNGLSVNECKKLCLEVDNSPSLSFWSHIAEARAFRDADTIELHSPAFALDLWNRIKAYLPPNISPQHSDSKIVIDKEYDENGNVDRRWERELVGTWTPCGFNHDLLFAKYPPGGSFAPHTDGRAIHDFNTRSFYSVIIFLNDLPSGCGGGTRFYSNEALSKLKTLPNGQWTSDSSCITFEIRPRAGRFLIFEQSLVHEGVPPLGECKYIIRSDVMFRRLIPLCDSPQDKTAYELYRQGEDLAEQGDSAQAIKLFRRALKLSPKLSQIIGQS